jgi:hypothetical protein
MIVFSWAMFAIWTRKLLGFFSGCLGVLEFFGLLGGSTLSSSGVRSPSSSLSRFSVPLFDLFAGDLEP